MSIQRVVRFKGGAMLLLFKGGTSKYIPSERYVRYRELMDSKKRNPRRGIKPPDTAKNCYLFFARLISYMEYKTRLKQQEKASKNVVKPNQSSP